MRPIRYQNRCPDDVKGELNVIERDPDGLPILPPEETFCAYTQEHLMLKQQAHGKSVPLSLRKLAAGSHIVHADTPAVA